jgi:hypothetical protein
MEVLGPRSLNAKQGAEAPCPMSWLS